MKIFFDNTYINVTSLNEYFYLISQAISRNHKETFFYLNSYSFYLLHNNSEFRKAFNSADYIIPDGYSIVWGIKKIYGHDIEKVTFNHSFFNYLIDLFVEKNVKIFFLGATEDILTKALQNLHVFHPKLKIVGSHHGYFPEQENGKVIQKIKECQPDIILVGMGMPKSEVWIKKCKDQIEAKCIFTVGNIIDIIGGKTKLAPNFLYNSGLEWLYRLFQEPGRLSLRYIKANSYFLIKVVIILLKLKRQKSPF